MPIPIYWKDPDDKLDYGLDWLDVLGENGTDTIVTSSWAAVPDDIVIESDTSDANTTTVWLSGGTAGSEYRATNTITTAGGREFERSIIVVVTDL